MTRTIRINADYLSETTIAKYINSVMLKMTKDLTMEKLKEQKRYLPEDLISLLAFAILQGFSYIEIILK